MYVKILALSLTLFLSFPIKSEVAADCNFNTSEHISELSMLKNLENIEIKVDKY
ncbi:MAG: hypothetical protein HN930_02180, partial [Pelagibacterales bacterium]|nr:hypothetical protein [Pelagibacterales bacterium]